MTDVQQLQLDVVASLAAFESGDPELVRAAHPDDFDFPEHYLMALRMLKALANKLAPYTREQFPDGLTLLHAFAAALAGGQFE